MKPKHARRLAVKMRMARSFAKLTAGSRYAEIIVERKGLIENAAKEMDCPLTEAAFALVYALQLKRPKDWRKEQNYLLAACVEMYEPSVDSTGNGQPPRRTATGEEVV